MVPGPFHEELSITVKQDKKLVITQKMQLSWDALCIWTYVIRGFVIVMPADDPISVILSHNLFQHPSVLLMQPEDLG